MTVLVCAAHDDDCAIGLGGTVAKLVMEGEEVILLVFFYGTGLSHRLSSWPPWISWRDLLKKRVFETRKASKILGIKKTYFFGLGGHKLPEKGFNDIKMQNLIKFIKKINPDKIFYHSLKDGHRDHLFVNKVVREAVEQLDKKPKMYAYQINLFDFTTKDVVVTYDVSLTYKLKLKAMKVFHSQVLWTALLEPMVLLKGIYYGKKHGFKFGEAFYSV